MCKTSELAGYQIFRIGQALSEVAEEGQRIFAGIRTLDRASSGLPVRRFRLLQP